MRRCSVLGFAARCWNTYMPLMTASVAACASLVPLLDAAFDSICTVCEGEVAAPSGGRCISPKPARPEDPRLSRAGAASPALSGGTPLQSLRPFSVRDGWLARGTRLVLSSGRRSAAIIPVGVRLAV